MATTRPPRFLLTALLIVSVAGTAVLLWRDLRPKAPLTAPDVSEGPPTRGGRLSVGLRSEPRSFNRHVSATAFTDTFTHLTQARLVRIHRQTHALEPMLAESWTTAPDGHHFTLHLRRNIQWSDGTPFTADDVVFSVEAAFDPAIQSVLAASLRVGGQPWEVRAVDPHTVILGFAAPFGPGLRLLDLLPVLPKHRLDEARRIGTWATAWGPATPPGHIVGLGPFQLTRYDPGQRVVLTRNPHYWRTDSDGAALPHLDEVVLEIASDVSTELLRLQNGQLDMLQQALRSEDVATLQPQIDAGALSLVELGVTTDPDAFVFNLRPAVWASDPRAPWATSRALRQALSHAVNREQLANAVFLGEAVPVWGPVTPGNTRWFSPNVPRYPYDRARARDLLKSVGLEQRDDDPWLEDTGGREARLTVLTFRGNTALERELAFVREAAAAIGVALDPVPLETNALISRMLAGDFETLFFSYSTSDLDPALTQDFWLSSGNSHLWHMAQLAPATPWEAEIDRLMRQQATTTDEPERLRLFADAQRVLAEEVPVLYFVAPRLSMGVSRRVRHVSPSVLRPHLLWAADSLSVAP
jgi:peptide/nickel transport system substrate-binding protein